jgi:D-sedoheptulose 7-phosphate isomerase
MNKKKFLTNYLNKTQDLLNFSNNDLKDLIKISEILINIRKKKTKVIICGNGGSAAISSHVSVDLTKNANVRCINFNESDLLTCFSNDYGYENWIVKSLDFYADKGDVLILISASGSSPNIIKATKKAKKIGLKVITFSGFKKTNPLKKLGDINLSVDSKNYNQIENVHQIMLLSICDLIIAQN